MLKKYRTYFQNLDKKLDELKWAAVWNDTKNNIEWIKNMPGISPGRWAVGYNYIYVMTRILNEIKPQNILEFGLGVSTTLISSYLDQYGTDHSFHFVLEHNSDWIQFYCNEHKNNDKTEIIRVDTTKKYTKGHEYNAYCNIPEYLFEKNTR